MGPARIAVIAVLIAVGLLWIGQGLDIIGGSVMSGSPIWAVIGAVLIAAAVLVAWSGRRRTAARS